MQGILTFSTLQAALQAGFIVYDGYEYDRLRVRRQGPHGYEFALVVPHA